MTWASVSPIASRVRPKYLLAPAWPGSIPSAFSKASLASAWRPSSARALARLKQALKKPGVKAGEREGEISHEWKMF